MTEKAALNSARKLVQRHNRGTRPFVRAAAPFGEASLMAEAAVLSDEWAHLRHEAMAMSNWE